MITPLSESKIKQMFGLEFLNSTKVTQFGGLTIFISFLVKMQFKERLEGVVGESCTKAILQIMLGTFVGAKSMEAIAEACKDKAVKDYLGSPVSETQIGRILKKLTRSQIHALHEFSLGLGLLDVVSSAQTQTMLTLDIDATPLEKYGTQEGVEVGYVGEDELKKCYQYLFVRIDQLNTLLYGTIRGGSAHSQNDFCGYLRMMLPMFGGAWPLSLRCDSGYFNEDAFELCCENSTWFFVKAPMSHARQRQAGSDQLEWIKDPKDGAIEYAQYETATKAGWRWREVFKRVDKNHNKGSLLPDYVHQCIATNDLSKAPWEVFEYYNKRARIENTNCELKNDYNLGKVVTKSFDVNDVITQSIVMLYQLVSHFKRYCLDRADQPRRLSTLRTLIFNVPGRYLSSARYKWVRVQNRFRDKLAYGRILARLNGLTTVFVIAPLLNTT